MSGHRIRQVEADGPEVWLWFWCGGCQTHHAVTVPRWSWNGDLEKPTFRPSVLVRGTVPLSDAEAAAVMAGEPFQPQDFTCHSYVTDGRIEYLSDSTHRLAGTTVDLPPISDSMGDEP